MDSVVEPDDGAPDFREIPWGTAGRTLTLGLVSLFGKAVLNVLNSTKIMDQAKLHELVMNRPQGVGLITVSNHSSTLDDPTLFSAMVPWSYYLQESKFEGIRWGFCADEICFRNEFLRQFFITGKVLPIHRGKGLDQPSLHQVAAMVKEGKWAHVFPEGKISFSGKLLPLRWGVGKMICDSLKEDGSAALVVPFYHSGMGPVMPKGSSFPRMGNEVEILVGEPVDLSDLTCKCNRKEKAWKEITSRIEEALRKLEEKAKPNVDQIGSKG